MFLQVKTLALRLEIRAEDIEAALALRHPENRGQLNSKTTNPTPASLAMERLTHSHWDTLDPLSSETFSSEHPHCEPAVEDDEKAVPPILAFPMILRETQDPFRFVQIPLTLREKMQSFCQTGKMEPCTYIVHIEEEGPSQSLPA